MFHWTSCLTEYMDPFCVELAKVIENEFGSQCRFYDPHWDIRQQAMAEAKLDGGFICGLLYVWSLSNGWEYEPIAAPVMTSDIASDIPVYHSEIMVRRDSPFHSFSDLAGQRLAVNEFQSFSGYHMLCQELGSDLAPGDYFSELLLSGSHWRSLAMISNGQADCATIDSTLIEMLALREPELLEPYRRLGSLGPYPAPPFVIAQNCPAEVKIAVQQLLVNLHENEAGARLLAAWNIARFRPVSAQTYDSIAALNIEL